MTRCAPSSSNAIHGFNVNAANAVTTVVATAITTGEMVWAKKISSSSTSVVTMAIRSPLPWPASFAGARRRNVSNALDRNSASSRKATLWLRYCSTYLSAPRTTAHDAISAAAIAADMPHTGLPDSANSVITANTGRKVAARCPTVPASDAAVISPASGFASCSRRPTTCDVEYFRESVLCPRLRSPSEVFTAEPAAEKSEKAKAESPPPELTSANRSTSRCASYSFAYAPPIAIRPTCEPVCTA